MAILESEGFGRPTANDFASAAGQETIDLVERARSGDVAAFDALVASRLMPTFRLVRAILGRTEESEDATQDAFIAAWRGLPNLRQAERFDAWFGRIIVNTCRMTMRRRPTTVVVPIDSVADGQVATGEDPGLRALVDYDALDRAIDRLPVNERSILALYYLDDRPMSTVARMLGIPTGTAKWQLWRARVALRRVLAEAEDRPARDAPPPRGRLAP